MRSIVLSSALVLAALLGCRVTDAPTVVLYTSVDQSYAEPIVREFERRSGIDVRAVYDAEAAKTTGLVTRILAERAAPRADVFWSSEFVQTLWLAESGALAPYASPQAEGIAGALRDADARWTGVGARVRVLAVNTTLLSPDQYPRSIDELLDPRWPAERIGIAHPLFGTTATHAAALYASRGRVAARDFFTTLEERGVQVLPGNAAVRDQVVSGRLLFGLTDNDDACAAMRRGAPLDVVVPDQDPAGSGALLIPSTVALIDGAPHEREAHALIDYLLAPEVEARLVEDGWFVASARVPDAVSPCPLSQPPRPLGRELAAVYGELETSRSELRRIFLR